VTKVLYVEHNDDNIYMLKTRLELLGGFVGAECPNGARSGSVRGALSNERPYRDLRNVVAKYPVPQRRHCDTRSSPRRKTNPRASVVSPGLMAAALGKFSQCRALYGGLPTPGKARGSSSGPPSSEVSH
jgi:hypothetical protein